MTRLIVGNLDCESEFARDAAASKAKPRPQGPLPQRVLTTIAGAATLLRVFARPGDRLWLPAPLPPESMIEVDGLPRPDLESGSLKDLEPSNEILAWGETRIVADTRPRRASLESTAPTATTLSQSLWTSSPTSASAACKVNDRSFCWALAHQLGCRLSGSELITSKQQLEAHLRAGGADASTDASWVLKARFSAAGRWRHIQRPGSRLDPGRIDRLFNRHGPLLFEPWMERVDDVGCSAILTPQGLIRIGCHRLLVDTVGRFRGIELQVDGNRWGNPWLDNSEAAELERTLEVVSNALQREGYVGPFGIDAWRYRTRDGQTAFHPLGEINGRMTFGLVAQALVERLRGTFPPSTFSPGTRVKLLFSRQAPSEPRGASDAAKVILLYQALQPTEQAIWLEIQPPQP